jgi:transcriptional regulator with XRE-family HTH domain
MRESHPIVQELRAVRRAWKKPLEEIAELSGYHRGQLSGYENGAHVPNLRTLGNWAQALGYELVLRPIKDQA